MYMIGNVDSSKKNSYIKPTAEIITGGLLIKKGVTSGLRRAMGIRLEQHTTSLTNAKNIIKNGCVLDPNFGGNGASRLWGEFEQNSKKYVHITGFHKDFMKKILENPIIEGFKEKITNNKWYKIICKTPLLNFVRAGYRKMQGLLYSATSTIEIPKNTGDDIFNLSAKLQQEILGSKKQVFKNIFNILTKRKSKTFYIGGSDKFFNEYFVPDTNDFALKTDKPLRVFRTKIGAIIDAIKKEGLSGIKQNKTRVATGLIVGGACLYAGYKLIKKGINKLKSNKKETPDDKNKKAIN